MSRISSPASPFNRFARQVLDDGDVFDDQFGASYTCRQSGHPTEGHSPDEIESLQAGQRQWEVSNAIETADDSHTAELLKLAQDAAELLGCPVRIERGLVVRSDGRREIRYWVYPDGSAYTSEFGEKAEQAIEKIVDRATRPQAA